jgi:putative flippase GtrA
MSTRTQVAHPVRRLLARAVLTVVGVVVAWLLYCVCQGMFSGYPKDHGRLLSTMGMVLIALTGGIAWIVDEHRMHDDD